MEALDSPFQEALDTPTAFIREVQIEAVRGEERATLEPEQGQVTQDARRAMRWDGSLTIPVGSDLIPTVPGDLLTPFGTLVEVRFGVTLAAGVSDTVPYGVLAVDASNVELAPDRRSVTLPLVDLGERIAGYRFESPFSAAAGDVASVVNAVIADRTGASPGLDDTGVTLTKARTFGLDPATDPWRELQDLVTGFGWRLYYDRVGDLILDQEPTFDGVTSSFAGPVSVAASFDHRPPNVIVVRGESSDDTTPVQAVAYDDDPASPTYAGAQPGGSPYGRVTRYYASPLIVTQSQADFTASQMLQEHAAAAATWTVAKAWDPTIDPDAFIQVQLDAAHSQALQVDAVTVDITAATSLECRAISELT